MGGCMSKSNAVQVDGPPHELARRLWIVAVSLDANQIPLDLAGIDSDGLKSAMINRGMEYEHWALKVDPHSQDPKDTSPKIFDINLEGDKLVPSVSDASSGHWRGILRKVPLGWTVWSDDNIFAAAKLLIQARPKYNGRTNNLQQLARILAKHIEYVPSQESTDDAHAPAPAPAPATGATSVMQATDALKSRETYTSPSQTTEASARPSDSLESVEELQEPQFAPNGSGTPSSAASSLRNSSNRMSRPPLPQHFSSPAGTNQHERESSAGERSNNGTRNSVSEHRTSRVYAQGRERSISRPSPLNPDTQRSAAVDTARSGQRKGSLVDLKHQGRSMSQTDVSQWGQNTLLGDLSRRRESVQTDDRRRSVASAGQTSRRMSQAYLDTAAADQGRGSVRQPRSKRASTLNVSPNSATWGPSSASLAPPGLPMVASQSDMAAAAGFGMPMSGSTMGMPMGMGMPPQMGMSVGMGGMGGMGGMTMSPSMGMPVQPWMTPGFMGPPTPMMPRPVSFYGGAPSPQWMATMPSLAPPSPGYASNTSSNVPTPPESPHLAPTNSQLKPPQHLGVQQQQQQQQHVRHASQR